MKRFAILILSLSFLSVACAQKTPTASKVRELILGKWWSMVGSEKITIEFAKDGTYKNIFLGQTTNGTYKWLDDSTIELNGKDKWKVTVTADELKIVMGTETSNFLREKGAANSGGEAPPASGSGTAAIIKQAVLAKRIMPLSRTPVEVTDKFPTTNGSIWAVATVSNAPPDTHIKAVMTAVDTGNAAPPNTKVTESESTARGSENVAFNWGFNSAPIGAYKIDIYLNGKLERTLPYSVTKEATPSSDSAAKTAAVGSCPKLPPIKENWPAWLRGISLAQGRDAQGKALNPGRIFRPDTPAFYAVLTTENIPANTKLAGRWVAEDVGGVDLCNAEFSSYEFVSDGSDLPWFSTTTPLRGSKWPEGLYRLDIYVNGTLAHAIGFGVCDGSCKFQVPLAWRLP